MKLQYQLSNGDWSNCDGSGYSTPYGFIPEDNTEEPDRTDEFLSLCEQNNRIGADGKITDRQMTRNEVIAALSAGQTLRNDRDDWYSNCRDLEAVERIGAERLAKRPPIEMVKCACGHTIPAGSVMSASLGSSCPECYDRMSV